MTESSLKFVILGEGRVGKTSILLRYFRNKFNDTEKSTLNPSFYEKVENYNGKKYPLKFWDTAGQEKFNALNAIYYQRAVGAILVYDVTLPETFDKVKSWVETLREAVGKDIIFVIAGNKFDLSNIEMRDKTEDLVQEYCGKEKCKHFYTSAKTGFNVNDIFESLIHEVLQNVENNNIKINKNKGRKLNITAAEKPVEKRGGCC